MQEMLLSFLIRMAFLLGEGAHKEPDYQVTSTDASDFKTTSRCSGASEFDVLCLAMRVRNGATSSRFGLSSTQRVITMHPHLYSKPLHRQNP